MNISRSGCLKKRDGGVWAGLPFVLALRNKFEKNFFPGANFYPEELSKGHTEGEGLEVDQIRNLN